MNCNMGKLQNKLQIPDQLDGTQPFLHWCEGRFILVCIFTSYKRLQVSFFSMNTVSIEHSTGCACVNQVLMNKLLDLE